MNTTELRDAPETSGASGAGPDRIGRLVAALHRTRTRIVLLWLVLAALAAVSASTLAPVLTAGGWLVRDSPGSRVAAAMADGFTGRGESTTFLVVHDRKYTADSPEFGSRVAQVYNAARGDSALQVKSAFGWSTLSATNRGRFLGKDRATAVTSLGLGLDQDHSLHAVPGIQDSLRKRFAAEGLDVGLVGEDTFWGEVERVSNADLVRGELITLPLIMIALLLLFRSVVSAVVAVAVGGTAIVLTLGVLSPVAHHVEMSIFVQNMATMLGLGLGIDYSLFVIKRFGDELASGAGRVEAMATTMRTSGRTVVTSGITVVAAMIPLFLVDLVAVRSMAIGAMIVVAMAMLVAVTVLPALLLILGPRIHAGRIRLPRSTEREPTQTRWYRWTSGVLRRPYAALAAGGVILLLAILPITKFSLYTADERILPQGNAVRAGFELLEQQFGTGSTAPITVLVNADLHTLSAADERKVDDVVGQLARIPGVAQVDSALPTLQQVAALRGLSRPSDLLQPSVFDTLPADTRSDIRYFISDDDHRMLVSITPQFSAADRRTSATVAAVRSELSQLPTAAPGSVGGQTATGDEADDLIGARLPWVMLAMVAIVYLILLRAFRSVFLPLKAILLNVLSVSATYGIMVLLFQDGWGQWFGMDHTGYLMFFVPVLLLALLFSLSTDYEVFVLSRVREEFLASGDNTRSVAMGMTRTAPLITGAAALMVIVFAGFGLAGIVPIQQLGVGAAIAVALDATVVRALLVPAAMRLMGRWNWWLPGSRIPKAG